VQSARRPADGMRLASIRGMRRCLTLVVGILIGQWFAFGANPAPADLYMVGQAAWQRGDYPEALRLWSHGTALQPGDPVLHFWRAAALARLGQRHAAADAFRLALILDPPASVAAVARRELASLGAPTPASTEVETTVPVEPARGVWLTSVVVNGDRPARFLVDTGSSVTLISPALARVIGLSPTGTKPTMELQTVGGMTAGVVTSVASLRVGTAEVHDVAVVIHDPGPGIDGILGNTFLSRYRLTLDADRRLLSLRRDPQ
jgi:clan AA aspartic protease (TIGR02281 family)